MSTRQKEAAFRKRIILWRELRAMSQSELAREMQQRGHRTFQQGTIRRLESGERQTRLSEAMTLAEILGAPLAQLVVEQTDGSEVPNLPDFPEGVATAMAYAWDEGHIAAKLLTAWAIGHSAGCTNEPRPDHLDVNPYRESA